MYIKQCKYSDLSQNEALHKLFIDCYKEVISNDDNINITKIRNNLLLLEKSGMLFCSIIYDEAGICGYFFGNITLDFFTGLQRELYSIGLYIKPNKRGLCGIRLLMNHIKAEGRKLCIDNVRICVKCGVMADKLLSKFGFLHDENYYILRG